MIAFGADSSTRKRPLWPHPGQGMPPGEASEGPKPCSGFTSPTSARANSPSLPLLAHWVRTLIEVQQAATGSPESLLARAARAAADLVGLDRVLVLLREGDAWRVAAQVPLDGPDPPFILAVLRLAADGKR